MAAGFRSCLSATEAVAAVAVAAICGAAGEDVIGPVLETLVRVMALDAGGLYEHQRDGVTIPLYLAPASIWDLVLWTRVPTATVRALHPGIDHLVANHPPRPYAVTDLVSERAWQTSELGILMRDVWDRNYQFVIPVLLSASTVAEERRAGPGAVQWAWVLGRTRREFSRHDREVAGAVQPVLDAVTRQWLATRARIAPMRAASIGVTNRELAVLQLLVDNNPPAQIARRLGISVRTTNKHLEHMYRKLDVHDRHAAVMRAITLGIADRGGPSMSDAVRMMRMDP